MKFNPNQMAPVIPVVVINNADHAVPLAEALLKGGIKSIEITFRTKAAAESIRQINTKCPDMIIGAGTVTTPEELKVAFDGGAKFAVAPGTSPKIVEYAAELEIPFFPGVSNPTDIEAALNLGCKILKFFPAEAMGGVNTLKAISAPYKHKEISFIPTGGISGDNFLDYLQLSPVLAVGGSWIADTKLIENQNWEEIINRCKTVITRYQQ